MGDIVYDPVQQAWLCMIWLDNGMGLELVEGKPVERYLLRGIRLYHVCYEVKDLGTEIRRISESGGIMVSGPAPAVLFGGRKVAFMYTRTGLIELLKEEK